MGQVNKKLLIVGFILVVIMGISGIYALAESGANQDNISAGNVDIKITEYTLNENNEEVIHSEQNKIVELGQNVSLIEKVKNLGEECYVRAKITIEGTDDVECVQGISGNWKKIDSYYYYEKKVNIGDEIKIFDTVKIPENMR